jgi:peptidoglycan/LPS O-acetylase OafA/YrhL
VAQERSASESGKARLEGLDALRGIAAIMVVLFHYTYDYQQHFGHTAELPLYFSIGKYGVELFFMISGYVILMTLDRTRSIGNFAFARFSRLYPAYWCAVATTFVVASLVGMPTWRVDFATFAINLSMLQEFFGVRHVDGVYWTLHAELRFYVLIAAVVWAGLRRHLILIFVALVLFDGVARYLDWPRSVPGLWRLYVLIPLEYLGLFLIGVVLYESRKDWKLAYVPVLAACVIVASMPHGAYRQLMLSACAAVVFVAIRWNSKLWTMIPGLSFLGSISYPLYLVHAVIGIAVIHRLERDGVPPLAAIAAAMTVALALAAANTYLVERPAMRRLRNWYRMRRDKAVAPRAAR